MGLAILGGLVLYALLSVVVVLLTIRHAKKSGKSATQWGCGAALVMYLIPFWDWLPTVAMHRYNCANEAGFWVYKTADQWKKENPGVMEKLIAYTDGRSSAGAYLLNQRFSWSVRKSGPLPLNGWRWEHQVLDSKSGDVLARYVNFSTGSGRIGGVPPLRFWIEAEYCSAGESNYGKFLLVKRAFQGAGG